MAYLPYDPSQDQDKEKDDSQPQQGGAGPVLGAPDAAPIQGTGQAASTSQGANKPSRSGSFTNLMSYVNANKGNDASMAGSIRSNVQSSANKADTAGATFQNTAKEAVGRGTVQQDAATQQGVRQMGNTAQPAAAPSVNQQTFNQQYNATYAGPTSAMDVQGFADTQAEHNKVANYGQLAAGDMSDRGALLSDVYGKGGKQYGGGERKLDSFILGAGDQGQAALRDVADSYSGYGQKFRGIMDTIGYRNGADGAGGPTGLIGEGVATSDATRDAMRAAVGDAERGLQGYFDPLAAEAAAKSNSDSERYKAITSGNVEALAAEGYSPEAIAFIKANPGIAARLAQAGSGYALGNLSDDAVEGNYGSLRGLISAAGGTAGIPEYDFTNTAGTSTAADPRLLAAINAGADDWKTQRDAVDAANARYAANWQMAQSDPSSLIQKFGWLGGSDLEALRASGVDMRSLFAQDGPATMGSFGNSQRRAALAELYGALGWDQAELAHNPRGYGVTFNKDLATQTINNYRAAQAAQAAAAAQKAAEEAAAQQALAAAASGTTSAASSTVSKDPVSAAKAVLSDERKKTDIRDVNFSEIEKFLKGAC